MGTLLVKSSREIHDDAARLVRLLEEFDHVMFGGTSKYTKADLAKSIRSLCSGLRIELDAVEDALRLYVPKSADANRQDVGVSSEGRPRENATSARKDRA